MEPDERTSWVVAAVPGDAPLLTSRYGLKMSRHGEEDARLALELARACVPAPAPPKPVLVAAPVRPARLEPRAEVSFGPPRERLRLVA